MFFFSVRWLVVKEMELLLSVSRATSGLVWRVGSAANVASWPWQVASSVESLYDYSECAGSINVGRRRWHRVSSVGPFSAYCREGSTRRRVVCLCVCSDASATWWLWAGIFLSSGPHCIVSGRSFSSKAKVAFSLTRSHARFARSTACECGGRSQQYSTARFQWRPNWRRRPRSIAVDGRRRRANACEHVSGNAT